MPLTFGAVIALPAGQADPVAMRRAIVVTELVVPGSAEVGTAGAVVVFVAEYPVLVAEGGLRLRRVGFPLVPVGAHLQPVLGGQPGDQAVAAS